MSQPASSETDDNSNPTKLSDSLLSAFETTLEKFTSSIQFSSFKKKYRAIYEEDPDGLKTYFDQLKTQLYKNIQAELRNCAKEHNILTNLQLLEKIKENKTAVSWRPSGNPEEDLRDHLYSYKVKHRDDLKNYLSTLQVDNEGISTEVTVNHSEILHLREKNVEMYKKFSSIIDSYAGRNFQNFQEKAVECFRELKADREKAAKHKNRESPTSEASKKPRVL